MEHGTWVRTFDVKRYLVRAVALCGLAYKLDFRTAKLLQEILFQLFGQQNIRCHWHSCVYFITMNIFTRRGEGLQFRQAKDVCILTTCYTDHVINLFSSALLLCDMHSPVHFLQLSRNAFCSNQHATP